MKAFFIVNPLSSNGKTPKRIEKCKEKLIQSFAECEIVETQGPGHATELTKKAIQDDFHHIFSVGGDGTLNEVINGYLCDDKPLNPDVIISVLPSGTGGDFRRSFGIKGDLEKAFNQIQSGSVSQIDIGKCTYRDDEGKQAVRYFNNVASFGLTDKVAKQVNESKWRKKMGGTVAFMVSGVQQILSHKTERVHINADGLHMRAFDINLVAIANGMYFAGGMKIAPHAKQDDGLFDIIMLESLSKSELIALNSKVYYGGHLKSEHVKQFRSKELSISAENPLRIELDGETPGWFPVKIEVLPQILKFKA